MSDMPMHAGCVERAKSILDAKNHWLNRAVAAESECDLLRAETKRLQGLVDDLRSGLCALHSALPMHDGESA